MNLFEFLFKVLLKWIVGLLSDWSGNEFVLFFVVLVIIKLVVVGL